MRKWELKTFIEEFCDDTRKDKQYCFILGAGASRQSGIPTGGELAIRWMDEIKLRYSSTKYEEWIRENNIALDDLAKDYSKIFEKRFEGDEEAGYAFLENIMEKAEPSIGYSVLAQILTRTKHNIVVTTNFDSLTEDALFIYTDKKPLVIGHEALANFIKTHSPRPVIVKIHRDVLLSPHNDTTNTGKMADNFKNNLEEVFKCCTPIFIGYGGNDGSLMKFLENLCQIKGHLLWLYWEKAIEPKDCIEKFVSDHGGFAIPIPGFDEVMAQIGDRLEFEKLDNRVKEVAEERSKKYGEQYLKIKSQPSLDADTSSALSGISNRGEESWWQYQIKIESTSDVNEKEKFYKDGLQRFPNSSELMHYYALFLEKFKKDYDEAEKYFKKSEENDSRYADNLGNYANFLSDIRRDYDSAEKYYLRAIEVNPFDAVLLGNYANFLKDIRKSYDSAEKYYLRAIELDPYDATNLGNYALFLKDIKNSYAQADEYYQRAIEQDPNHANNLGLYATFLEYIKKNLKEAEKYYLRAIKQEPEHTNNLGNYANFLCDVNNNYDEAEKYFMKAIKKDIDHANNFGNYGKALVAMRRLEEAKEKVDRAIELNAGEKNGLEVELWFYRYAVFYKDYPESKSKIEELLKEGVRSPGWNLDGVLAVAKELGHPDYAKLEEFAKEITKEE